ncbi:MAG TPA: hypothetical protein VNM66_04935 [Thermodesulfobacteriota bacterium]|nr:hypothetical protein [Thermodesulfobacteriota bacterium]
MTGRVALLALAAWLGATVCLADLDRVRPRFTGAEGHRYLELARRARPALLGYDALAADVVWLQAIQYIADRTGARRDLAGLYPFLDAATELDPRYQVVYYLGGTALVALDRRPDEALRLLEKGERALPTDWQIPFLLGYTHLFYYQDFAAAARYIERAAANVGRPTYLTNLAARLYAEAGSPEAALAFLERMRQQTTDPAVRAGIEERMGEVVVDRELKRIDAAVAAYRAARHRAPQTIEELVRTGYLVPPPVEPFGGRYRLDPQTGTASTTSGRGRLKIYRRGG